MAVVGGRVIPMFSNNGIPGLKAVRLPRLEKAALGSVLLLLVADLLQLPAPYIAGIAACAALTNFWRLCLWQPWRVLVAPMVWVLHMAYAWIAFHFTLRSLAAFGLVGEAMAVHALTIGAIGGMTLGMMTRTARGHSGLQIAAGRAELACFILVQAAALTRVFGGLFLTAHYITTVWVAASLWSIAFAIFFVRYWTILTRPRQ